jgi:hypothetical protein
MPSTRGTAFPRPGGSTSMRVQHAFGAQPQRTHREVLHVFLQRRLRRRRLRAESVGLSLQRRGPLLRGLRPRGRRVRRGARRRRKIAPRRLGAYGTDGSRCHSGAAHAVALSSRAQLHVGEQRETSHNTHSPRG